MCMPLCLCVRTELLSAKDEPLLVGGDALLWR